MTQRMFHLLVLTACMLGTDKARAGFIYDNGPIAGITAVTLTFPAKSDSFTLNSAASLTQIQLGLWTYPGDVPLSVQWSIGTTPFGNDVNGGGIAALDNSSAGSAYGIYPLFESTFAATGNLAAGTYWLSLQNGTASNGDPIYWDQNGGPSSAEIQYVGSIPSNSFQISGGPANATPAPSSLCLLGVSAAVLGFVGWHRRKLAAGTVAI